MRGKDASLCTPLRRIEGCDLATYLVQLQPAGERDPNVSTMISCCLPSWQRDNMPAPFGNRSPDLPLPGPELSRGFSRSASHPQGQVFGGAITRWSYSRPKASRRQHWHWHGASESCVWELPDIRLSMSRCVCHGPDRGQRRSCFRAAVVADRNPPDRPCKQRRNFYDQCEISVPKCRRVPM